MGKCESSQLVRFGLANLKEDLTMNITVKFCQLWLSGFEGNVCILKKLLKILFVLLCQPEVSVVCICLSNFERGPRVYHFWWVLSNLTQRCRISCICEVSVDNVPLVPIVIRILTRCTCFRNLEETLIRNILVKFSQRLTRLCEVYFADQLSCAKWIEFQQFW